MLIGSAWRPLTNSGAFMNPWSYILGFSIFLVSSQNALAKPLLEAGRAKAEQTSLVDLGPSLSPFQHVRFCLHYPADCSSNSIGRTLIDLNTETLRQLNRVNHQINSAIVPARKNYGVVLDDSWTIAPDQGDCNDYAVTKRHELLRRGLPSSALRLSVVKTAAGQGHLLLFVATTKGALILDNLTNKIRFLGQTNYQWIKMQSENEPQYWIAVSLFSDLHRQ